MQKILTFKLARYLGPTTNGLLTTGIAKPYQVHFSASTSLLLGLSVVRLGRVLTGRGFNVAHFKDFFLCNITVTNTLASSSLYRLFSRQQEKAKIDMFVL